MSTGPNQQLDFHSRPDLEKDAVGHVIGAMPIEIYGF